MMPDSSATPPRGGRVALQIGYAHVTGGTLLGGPALCPSGGGTTNVFTPLTGALATANLGKVRSALETQATDDVTVTLAHQTSNDGVTWSSSTALPGTPSRTADGISYPEGWTSFTVTTARHVRFGIAVVNTGGSGDPEIRGVVATVRVDWRDA